MLASDVAVEQGQRLVAGRYLVTERLGAGAMGHVWAARDQVLRREVALKEVLPPTGVTGRDRTVLVERTRREARAAAAVASPSVMTVYDVVDEGDRTWIVMERLPPRTLADVLAEDGPLPVPEAAGIGLAVLDALDAAHAAGVVHRDVKPGNVLWGPGGRVVLADFGIAQAAWEPTLTEVGVVLGSPTYLAPERARGGAATPASDLWSLGALLFVAVEGRPPFTGDGPLAVLTSVVGDDVPPAPRARALRPAIEGLLRKDPAQRMTSAQARPLLQRARRSPEAEASPQVEMSPELRAARRLPPLVPVAELEPAPARTPRRRRRGLLVAAAVGALAVPAVLALQSVPGAAQDGAPSAAPTVASPAATAAAPSPRVEETTATTPAETAEPTAEPTASPEVEAAAAEPVPAGLEPYTDETGFSVAVPAGWQPEREGPRVRFRDPGSSRYLLVDQTDQPKGDPLADWEQQEPTVAQRLENYERLRLERVEVPYAASAAEIEFLHGESQGVHVLNRNLLVDGDSAYALYWSVPDATWEQDRALFDAVASTFRPAP